MTQPLAIRGAVVNLGGRPVLQHVDLDVAEGEFVALLGTNGSGKSTLVRAAIGLVPLAEGTVDLFGVPLAKFSAWQRLGYVPQRSTAVSGVPSTVHEVVMSGRLARRRLFGHRTKADLDAVVEAVIEVGLADRLHDSVTDLSGGQQQRILIARALAAKADFLIMDEPFAGVDQDNQESLAELLGGLVKNGTSVLLVAHELGPLEPLVDRAVGLRAGTVEYCGPVSALAASEQGQVHPHTGRPAKIGGPIGEGPWK
ncbi:MAG: metal ABC transporter ATP-binding protein [Aeromicrobium sp.]